MVAQAPPTRVHDKVNEIAGIRIAGRWVFSGHGDLFTTHWRCRSVLYFCLLFYRTGLYSGDSSCSS